MRILRLLFCGFLLLGGAVVQCVAQAPATIYLIRHAEKLYDGREDLSEAGFARAAVLAQLFIPPAGSSLVPLERPQVLIATHASKKSNRPVETITPLAKALGLLIESNIMNDDYPELAKELLSGKYAGKIVLVSWHHGNIPALAKALGATPPYSPWPEMQFDRIWRIDYHAGKATLTDLPQALMPGDSK
ncbi:histidine phosphatase family protein [Granulicella sp. WH15]|uniref:histidine phosphatase family protein n=1 Tax=Granulicella sp. WH15 TaxID=2602070 RepID=UPI001366C5A5|nr:histidine phosphatase family protein [Granulicella sp. WH15]QHN03370.1 histidine phosphatase family protein [Granulicella sp. WH15]